jgi:hypothetical protein
MGVKRNILVEFSIYLISLIRNGIGLLENDRFWIRIGWI